MGKRCRRELLVEQGKVRYLHEMDHWLPSASGTTVLLVATLVDESYGLRHMVFVIWSPLALFTDELLFVRLPNRSTPHLTPPYKEAKHSPRSQEPRANHGLRKYMWVR